MLRKAITIAKAMIPSMIAIATRSQEIGALPATLPVCPLTTKLYTLPLNLKLAIHIGARRYLNVTLSYTVERLIVPTLSAL